MRNSAAHVATWPDSRYRRLAPRPRTRFRRTPRTRSGLRRASTRTGTGCGLTASMLGEAEVAQLAQGHRQRGEVEGPARRISVSIAPTRATARPFVSNQSRTAVSGCSVGGELITHASVSSASVDSSSSRTAERAWVCQRSDAGQGPDRLPEPHQVEGVEQRPLHGGQLGRAGARSSPTARRDRTRCAAAATARPARRGPRARRRRAATPRPTSRRRPCAPATSPPGDAASSAIPGRNQAVVAARSNGGRRWRSTHSAPRSTMRRQSRNRPIWVSSGHDAARGRRSRPTGRRSRTRRCATIHARVTSTTDAPVSSVMRWSNEMPDRLTIWLTTAVAMISRRSGWAAIASREALAQRVREGSRRGRRSNSRLVGQVGAHHLGDVRVLRVGDQHGELGRGRARRRPVAARRSACRWAGTRGRGRASPRSRARRCSGRARWPSARPAGGRSPAPASGPSCGRARARPPRRSSTPSSVVALLRSSARRPPPRPSSRILMFTSWSLQSTPAELSMASV